MGEHVNDERPRVPNPVNPGTGSRGEDFADKWYTEEGRALGLEKNFWRWLYQARADFNQMAELQDADDLAKRAEESLGVPLDVSSIQRQLGQSSAAGIITATESQGPEDSPKTNIESPPEPWATW
jgi:hypothetical protein